MHSCSCPRSTAGIHKCPRSCSVVPALNYQAAAERARASGERPPTSWPSLRRSGPFPRAARARASRRCGCGGLCPTKPRGWSGKPAARARRRWPQHPGRACDFALGAAAVGGAAGKERTSRYPWEHRKLSRRSRTWICTLIEVHSSWPRASRSTTSRGHRHRGCRLQVDGRARSHTR